MYRILAAPAGLTVSPLPGAPVHPATCNGLARGFTPIIIIGVVYTLIMESAAQRKNNIT